MINKVFNKITIEKNPKAKILRNIIKIKISMSSLFNNSISKRIEEEDYL